MRWKSLCASRDNHKPLQITDTNARKTHLELPRTPAGTISPAEQLLKGKMHLAQRHCHSACLSIEGRNYSSPAVTHSESRESILQSSSHWVLSTWDWFKVWNPINTKKSQGGSMAENQTVVMSLLHSAKNLSQHLWGSMLTLYPPRQEGAVVF